MKIRALYLYSIFLVLIGCANTRIPSDADMGCEGVSWYPKSYIQDAYLKASNVGGDWFGYSVSAYQDTIVVGAYKEDSDYTGVNNSDGLPTVDNDNLTDSGAAYVFKKDNNGNWFQDAYLKPSTVSSSEYFGFSVGIYGNIIAIGAPYESGTATNSGAVYVFERDSNGNWLQSAYLKASNIEASAEFGYSLSIYEDTVVIGTPYEDANGITDSGAVYVFKRNADGTWTQESYLNITSSNTGDMFGYSVGIYQNIIAVGVPYEDNTGSDSGAVYVFERDGSGNWIKTGYLKASNANGYGKFGYSVAVYKDLIVVGAIGEDNSFKGIINTDNSPNTTDASSSSAGAVYVFKKAPDGTWIQDAYIKASNTGASDLFGSSLAVSEDTIVVGAINEDSSTSGVINENGQPTQDNDTDTYNEYGAVYIFRRYDGTSVENPPCTIPEGENYCWYQEAYLKASNPGLSDYFGRSVSITGDTLAIGAHQEAGDGTPERIINEDGHPLVSESNDNISYSGAVYVFKALREQ